MCCCDILVQLDTYWSRKSKLFWDLVWVYNVCVILGRVYMDGCAFVIIAIYQLGIAQEHIQPRLHVILDWVCIISRVICCFHANYIKLSGAQHSAHTIP